MRPDQTPATGPADKAAELAHHRSLVAPIELGLRPAHDAAATARAAVSAGLAAHLGEVVLADALLLVAELVTNSVRHAQAPADAVITVRASCGPTCCGWRSSTAGPAVRSRAGHPTCTTAVASA